MNSSEANRNARRDRKRHASQYDPVRHNGVKGLPRYEWFRRKQNKKA